MPADAQFASALVPAMIGVKAGSISVEALPPDAAGTERTLAVMAAAVRGDLPPDNSGFRDEVIRRTAVDVCRGIEGHDFLGEVASLFFFVRDKIRYRKDPIDTERVQDAKRTLELRSGDCDDKCVLLASMLAAMGHLPQFVVQAQDGKTFDHVYVEAWSDEAGDWIALDPTADGLHGRPRGVAGWRNPAAVEWTYRIFDL